MNLAADALLPHPVGQSPEVVQSVGVGFSQPAACRVPDRIDHVESEFGNIHACRIPLEVHLCLACIESSVSV